LDKLTYLAELAEGLARWVPERERQDILRYYAEYFEEAGPDREAEVVRELGDPWALSSRLAVEGGYVTQEQANSWTPKKKKRWPWVLIGAAAVLIFVAGPAALLAQLWGVIGRAVPGPASVAPTVVEEGVVTDPAGFGSAYDGGAWSMEGGSLDAFSEIDLDVGLANVTVCSGDDYTLSVGRNPALDGYELRWEVKGGALKIKDGGKVNQVQINNWGDLKEGLEDLFRAQGGIDVIITVPDGTILDKISVKTGLGDVMLYGVGAAKVSMETGMGDVECYDTRQVKKLDLDTGMGDVTLSLDEVGDGMDIDLESGMGNVEAVLGCSERDCEYELESGMGNVMVNNVSRGGKAEHKGNMPYKLDAESGMGDVNVSFTSD